MLEHLKRIKIAEIEEKILAIKQELPQKYNWFERNIFKKREYEEYQRQQKRIRREQLEELEVQKNKYLNAKCIQQLGLDLTSAIEILNQHGISEMITESEMQETTYMPTKPYVNSMEGLILVHKTKYVPNNGRIQSVKEAEVYEEIECQIADRRIPISVQRTRDTVHFAVNGEVQEHFAGNDWDKCKYAVLIPFIDIPKEKYARVFANDTYTHGGVDLTKDSWILVPNGEAEITRKNNPGVNVIEYDGPNVTGYADKLIRILGYRQQHIDPGAYGGWRDNDANNTFGELIEREGFSTGIHYNSQEHIQEKYERTIQVITQLIQYTEANPEMLSNQEYINQLQETMRSHLVGACNQPKELCNALYNHMMSLGYTLPEERIIELSAYGEEAVSKVNNALSTELISMLVKKHQISLEQSQGIKK